jgi:P27 family predicted phage terminase small subunit
MKTKETAPSHLRPATRAWFEAVLAGYVMEEHHVRLLTLAGEAWDRNTEARERLAKDGLTIEGREGMKVHPCVAIERDARAAFARLVAQLGLDDDTQPKRGPGRPGLGGIGVTHEFIHGLPERPTTRGARQRKGPWNAA